MRRDYGSSPLARGLLPVNAGVVAICRIIPARAGFTTPAQPPEPTGSDHPRSRGVYCELSAHDVTCTGSSPLARGLPRTGRAGRRRSRIIPARAGFTRRQSDLLGWGQDHPRSRGVYLATAWGRQVRRGSSPLARGLLRGHAYEAPGRGIIPARAGFTSAVCPGRARRAGSSPLARGLRGAARGGVGSDRIIPARAGFTHQSGGCGPASGDHPRSRGVYSGTKWCMPGNRGSSPLARGLQVITIMVVVIGRIIPARAGFTPEASRTGRPGTDHPRSRGVYSTCPMLTFRLVGSSPLARGLHNYLRTGDTDIGIIPARAGFTSLPAWCRIRTPDHPRSRGVYGRGLRPFPFFWGSSPLARGLHLRILGIPTTRHPTRLRLPSLPT